MDLILTGIYWVWLLMPKIGSGVGVFQARFSLGTAPIIDAVHAMHPSSHLTPLKLLLEFVDVNFGYYAINKS